MNQKEKEKKFADFLNKNDVLIVDKSSASRRRLAKTLSELGAKMINILMTSNLEEAVTILKEKRPRLVLSDYTITGGSGFDLFKIFREECHDSKFSTLILVTSNSSQSAVAKAAEEDVDAFIIKPYTVETLSQGIINAFITKNYPNDYIKTIEEGKELLFDKSYMPAQEKFKKAIQLHKSPSLAYFYLGQVQKLMNLPRDAEGKFQEGLNLNHIHYKCQVGLFDLFYEEEKYDDAYEIVKNIAKYFPSNPDRLQSIVRLAVMTKNYSDMEYYYEIFTALEMRSDDTIKYICAGLYVAGKFLFRIGDIDKGIEFFKKVSVSAEGKTIFLRSMIEVLALNNQAEAAQDVMKRFLDESKSSDDFFISKFLTLSMSAPPEEFITEGIALLNKGIKNETCFKIFLTGLKDKGFEDKYEEYLEQAIESFPERAEYFKAS